MKKFFLLFSLLSTFFLFAQEDSLVFTYKEFIENIIQYHPVAKQADLRNDLAKSKLLKARGNFDPKIEADYKQKELKGTEYYRNIKSKLKIPTKLPIDIVAGYKQTNGAFINPEETTDPFGLWNAGIEMNVLQGLITDERRTALRQAKTFGRIAENQRQIILNDLLLKASNAYVEWQRVEEERRVIFENIDLAETYLQNTKASYLGGEKTRVDTLEAFILKQDITLKLQENETKLNKVKRKVENYLWLNDLPLEISENTLPDLLPREATLPDFITDFQPNQNPEVQEKINKLEYYQFEQRLKKQKLLPKLKLKYNPLFITKEDVFPETSGQSIQNFEWGFDFSFPIFMRKARGDLLKNTVKIKETEFDIQNKELEISNKIEASVQNIKVLNDQIELQRQQVDGYKKLLDAENTKFGLGESSVFLINKRQEKYIKGRIKEFKLIQKRENELLNYLYLTNQMLP